MIFILIDGLELMLMGRRNNQSIEIIQTLLSFGFINMQTLGGHCLLKLFRFIRKIKIKVQVPIMVNVSF